MPDSYKDLTHSAAEIDAAVGKADTAVQPGDIGTAAAQDVDYFATSAQGAKADTAVQPGDIGTAAAQDVEYFATASQGAKADTAVQPGDLGTAATASASDFATATQGGKADSAIQGLKVNSSTVTPDSDKIISITIPTSASDINALPNTTKYAAAIEVSINSSTYVMTVQLKDQNGDNLGSSDSIDLPLETMVVGGSYDSTNKKVILTLKNGETVEFSVADLVSGLQTELSASNKLNPAYINYDSTHRAVSDTEKSTWNGKQDALTTEQLNAVNSGINSTKVAQIAKNEAALEDVINDGPKNHLPYPDLADLSGTLVSSATINADKSITITTSSALSSDGGINYNVYIPAGTYRYSAIEGSSTAETNAYDSYIQKQVDGSWTTVIRDNTTNPGNVATLEAGEYRVTLRLRRGLPAGSYTFKPMLCAPFEYEITSPYRPYGKTNPELTDDGMEDRAALVEVVDSGAKNLIEYAEIGINATHGTSYTVNGVTFTMNPNGTVTATRVESSNSDSTCNLRTSSANLTVDSLCDGKHVLSGCPSGGSSTTYSVVASRNTYRMEDYGDGIVLDSTSEVDVLFTLAIRKAFTGTLTFKPMICTKAAWDISHTYRPYRPTVAPEDIAITDISDKITPASGVTIQSDTRLWKQGNHIFGQIVATSTSSFATGANIATLDSDFRPSYEQRRPCACIDISDNSSTAGFYSILKSSSSYYPGVINVYPTGMNCVKIAISIDFVL